MIGVDVASVDGNRPINWLAAYRAGVRFAVFRADYITWPDPVWRLEAARARAAGITVQAYVFPVMNTNAPEPEIQMQAFLDATAPFVDDSDGPHVLDVEFPQGIAKTGHTRRQLLEWILKAVKYLHEKLGYYPEIYSSERVIDGSDTDSLDADVSDLDLSELAKCPFWASRYITNYRLAPIGDTPDEIAKLKALPRAPVPKLWGPGNCWIRQYQGDSIGFPGFTATADLNWFYVMVKGETGPRVSWVQKKLGMAEGKPGVFDDAMYEAVRAFQRSKGLVDDGEIGARSYARLARLPA